MIRNKFFPNYINLIIHRLDWVAFPFCFFWLTLPIAHVPAIRNMLALIIGTGALIYWIRCRAPLPESGITQILWLLFCLASVSWSLQPHYTFTSWTTERLLPLMCFLGHYWLLRTRESMTLILTFLMGGLFLLLITSISAFTHGATLVTSLANAIGINKWYIGVGSASTYAACLLAPAWIFARYSQRWNMLGYSVLLMAFIIGILSFNRMFWIAGTTGLMTCLYLTIRVGLTQITRRTLYISIAATAIILGIMTVMTTHLRREAISPPHPSGAAVQGVRDTLLADSRPKLWYYWGSRALEHPWLGHGGGRLLAGRVYRHYFPMDLARIDPNAASHAHNIVLNLILQYGLFGLILFSIVIIQLLRAYLHMTRTPSLSHQLSGIAGVGLIVTWLAKNITDDFTVFETTLMFWSLAGILFAVGTRNVQTTLQSPAH